MLARPTARTARRVPGHRLFAHKWAEPRSRLCGEREVGKKERSLEEHDPYNAPHAHMLTHTYTPTHTAHSHIRTLTYICTRTHNQHTHTHHTSTHMLIHTTHSHTTHSLVLSHGDVRVLRIPERLCKESKQQRVFWGRNWILQPSVLAFHFPAVFQGIGF